MSASPPPGAATTLATADLPVAAAATSHARIVKTTLLIGTASVIGTLLAMTRAKIVAVWLGADGVGLLGLFLAISGTATATASLGLANSGVRRIAKATGEDDAVQVARTIRTLRHTSIGLGLVGALVLAGASEAVCRLTFGDASHWGAVAVLGLCVLFGSMASARSAMVQGTRRVADLARMNALGALLGTAAGIPVVLVWRETGVVLLLVALSGGSLVASWWFARRIPLLAIPWGWRETVGEARTLSKLGVAFWTSGLVTMGSAYLIRLLLMRELGLDAVGMYFAAYAVAGVYTGYVLQAMTADFYPRLSAVADDHPALNRLVNEQVEMSLTLALPGILATVVFAPVVIQILYSAEFAPAVELLRWLIVGVLGTVATWPLAYVLLAKARSRLHILSEVSAGAMHIALVFFALRTHGLMGAGMAFIGFCLWGWLYAIVAARYVTGFRLTRANVLRHCLAVGGVGVVVLLQTLAPGTPALVAGCLITAASAAASARVLLRHVTARRLWDSFRAFRITG